MSKAISSKIQRLRFDSAFPVGLIIPFVAQVPITVVLFLSVIDIHSFDLKNTILGLIGLLLFLFMDIYLLKPLFWRIVLNINKKSLSFPYFKKVDASPSVYYLFIKDFLSGKSAWDANRFSGIYFPIFSHERSLPYEEIHSILIAPVAYINQYIDLYKGDSLATKKLQSYYNHWLGNDEKLNILPGINPTTIGILAGTCGGTRASFEAGLVGGLVSSLLINEMLPIIKKSASPEFVLIIRTKEECIMRTLSPYKHEDYPYFAEAARSAGIRVLNPEDKTVAQSILDGKKYATQKFRFSSLGALLVSFVSVIILTINLAMTDGGDGKSWLLVAGLICVNIFAYWLTTLNK